MIILKWMAARSGIIIFIFYSNDFLEVWSQHHNPEFRNAPENIHRSNCSLPMLSRLQLKKNRIKSRMYVKRSAMYEKATFN